jgi:hemolysin D
VVPVNDRLEVEANLANDDIGFVHPGQDVAVKVDAFDFTRFGLLHGTVSDVSPDVITPPPAGQPDAGANPPATAQGFAYRARVALDAAVLPVGNQSYALRPGMTVTVEVNTGTRRIISYLLSPLIGTAEGSITER